MGMEIPKRNENRPHPSLLERKHVCAGELGSAAKVEFLLAPISNNGREFSPRSAPGNLQHWFPFPFVDRFPFRFPELAEAG